VTFRGWSFRAKSEFDPRLGGCPARQAPDTLSRALYHGMRDAESGSREHVTWARSTAVRRRKTQCCRSAERRPAFVSPTLTSPCPAFVVPSPARGIDRFEKGGHRGAVRHPVTNPAECDAQHSAVFSAPVERVERVERVRSCTARNVHARRLARPCVRPCPDERFCLRAARGRGWRGSRAAGSATLRPVVVFDSCALATCQTARGPHTPPAACRLRTRGTRAIYVRATA
jgi:hypothetical protein